MDIRKLIKECVTQVLREELEDPLYVEYVSERPGEDPFMLQGQKFQYVNAKYPNGKIDIGIYAFAGDIVYSYNAFRQMHGINEIKGTIKEVYIDDDNYSYDIVCPKCHSGQGAHLEDNWTIEGGKVWECDNDWCKHKWKASPNEINEAFDPTSVGPNPEASEGLSDGNPYAAWNAKMRQLEDMELPIDDKTNLKSPHPEDQTLPTDLPPSGEKKYYKQQPGGDMAAVNTTTIANETIFPIHPNDLNYYIENSGLTERDKVIIRLKLQGYTNEEIAKRFNVSTSRITALSARTIKRLQNSVRQDNASVPFQENDHGRYAQEAGANGFGSKEFSVHNDGFDEFRKEIGEEKVNEFLAKFGLGPNYKPSKPKLYECPQCKRPNAQYKEEHPDTDMNEMVLECPDCGYSKN